MDRLQKIQQLAGEEAKKNSSSPRDWMGYLGTAARLYRYPFSDTMLIHAQRPGATACVSLEDWNGKVGRWVRRGAKGIALLDDSGAKMKLKYVFDVSDTRLVQGGWTPVLWKMEQRHEAEVLSCLSDTYGLKGKEAAGIGPALMEVSSRIAEENLKEAMRGLDYEVEGTYLEGLGEDAVRVSFRELLKNSIFYAAAIRCGLDPMEYLEEGDFVGIMDFNTPAALAVLGNAISSLTEPLLRGIGRTVKEICLKEEQKALENRSEIDYNKFSTLKRETESRKGGSADGTDIPLGGGLPDPGPDNRGGAEDHREIRDAAEDVPEREPGGLVPGHDAGREAGQPSGGHRGSGSGEDGSPGGRASGEISGTGQGEGPAGVGSPHEQPEGHGGGERLTGIGVQLEENGQDIKEAGETKAPAFSAHSGRFPSVEQQIRKIEERVQALYAGEITIPAEVVDEVLRAGGNRKGSLLRIIYHFMAPRTEGESAEFIRKEYGTGGRGIIVGGMKYSVWHDELGMQVAAGDSVHGAVLYKAFLTWEEVSGRIHQLLRQGEYAPQEVLDEACSNADTEHMDISVPMEKDMAEGAAVKKPLLEAVPYRAREGFAWEEAPAFITQDEIDAYLTKGKHSDWRLGIYSYFIQDRTDKERAAFLWKEYGTGGGGTIYDNAEDSGVWHDGKGLLLTRGRYGDIKAEALLKWPAVAKRIKHLIEHDRYLSTADISRMPEYEKERIVSHAANFYSRIPEAVTRPWDGTSSPYEHRDEIAGLLGTPEGGETLVKNMGQALAALPADFEGYDEKERLLEKVRGYVEGTYTIFPEKKKGIQEGIRIGDSVQLSLFDFMDMDAAPVEKKASPEEASKEYPGQGAPEKFWQKDFSQKEPFQKESVEKQEENVLPMEEAPEREGAETINPLPDMEHHQETVQEQGADIAEGEKSGEGGHSGEWENAEERKKLPAPTNFRITNDDLGAGGPKQKFRANMEAVITLKKIEGENRTATPEEQDILSRYVGWGGIPAAFEEGNGAWAAESMQLKQALTEEEYRQARASTLNAFYTPPVVIKAMYEALGNMGLSKGNVLEPSCGTGNFMGLVPEGTGYRAKMRFARFYNLPELMSLFKECADIQTADLLDLPVPEAEYVNEVLKPSPEQQEMVKAFAQRAEAVRAGGVDPAEDNMLRITNDGRKCALDQRLLNDMLPDAEGSKANRCVENAFGIWKSTMQGKSAQMIFCDLSTPKAGGIFNVYDDVREKLVAMGIPKEQVAFIHEAATETKKAELFAKVRSGQVRILIGSTPKLGAGTNVQDRLIALHHLDCPWKPAELEQQEGRILRQGNNNKKVWIYRYVTESTFDAYLWQILENKQKFISQIMTSKSPVRSCEDVDDTALSYAEIKSLATGNVHIKEKMELDIQVSKLKVLKADFISQKYRLEADIVKNYPADIAALKERVAGLSADVKMAAPVFEKEEGKDKFAMEIKGRVYTDRKEAGEAFLYACQGLRTTDEARQVGSFSGFTLAVFYNALSQQYMARIGGKCSYRVEVGRDALGNMQRISNALARIPEELKETKQKLENVQRQLAIAKEEVEKPFVKEAELQEKLERLAELNVLLNMDEKSPAEAVGLDDEDREADDIQDIPERDMEEDIEKKTAGNSRENNPGISPVVEETGEGRTEEPEELEDPWEDEEGYACETGNGYFSIQETEGGYDYTFYGEDYRVLDGGVYENLSVPIWEAAEDILTDEGLSSEKMVTVDYGWLMEKAEEAGQAQIQKLPLISGHTEPEGALNGLSRAEVEEMALCYAQAQIEEAGLDGDVELLGARVYGSRTREGLYREGSDIDVVISYTGDIREDAFFNLLHEEDFGMAGLPVDMNPISLEKTGTLEEYLENTEKYLDSEEARLKSARAGREAPGSMETGQAPESRERRSVLAALKERQSAIEKRENRAENLKEYKKRGQEL